MSSPQSGGRRWLVWGAGLAVYMLAIFHRSSLAVAGLAASERFHLGSTALATFTMVQLLVYAGMQIPVGLMVDRYGPRSVLTGGLVLMSLAQTGFGLATSYPEALAARVFVGMGDAMTFICVLRLVNFWFPLRRIPLITQLTGNVGQLGALGAAVPMTWALGHLGWTAAYLVAAAIGGVLLVVVLLVLHDAPHARHARGVPLSWPALRTTLVSSWSQPGTRLGFWVHFSTPFTASTLALLWGYPFFVKGEGLSSGAADALLSLIVIANVTAGPTLGWLIGRHPWHRSTLALGIVAAIATTWTTVLAWPGTAPLWLLAVTVFVSGAGGPASMIAFDVARTSNPAHRLASASGIINQGGFVAALIAVVAIGWVLDWRSPGGAGDYTPDAFRWAMSVQYVLWALGVAMIVRYRRQVRARVSRPTVDGGSTMVEDAVTDFPATG